MWMLRKRGRRGRARFLSLLSSEEAATVPIFDLFSKRLKARSAAAQDVYRYDVIPQPLRVQIVYIWQDALGNPNKDSDYDGIQKDAYQFIVDTLCREYGVFYLGTKNERQYGSYHPISELVNFFLSEIEFNKTIDIIELSFRVIDKMTRKYDYFKNYDYDNIVNQSIAELNNRFREHAVGYFYSDGAIIRIDSQLIHNFVVKPSLIVLHGKLYSNAEIEFLSAHTHYRDGKHREALVDCYKAFESVMKIICTKRKWPFDNNKSTNHLVDVLMKNGLIPSYWQNHFNSLRTLLETAIPTPRNKTAGHGAGAAVMPTPPAELVAYVLHMTAATILFLAETEKKLS
jgi:hypothetical protein